MDIQSIVKPDFVILEASTTLSEMIGILRTQEKRSSLIFKNKNYVGLIEKKKLLRSRLDATATKIGHYLQKTPIVNESLDVLDTALLMAESDTDLLPVERKKSIIGVVDGLSLVALACQLQEVKSLTVANVKLAKLRQLQKDDPIAEAILLMHEEGLDPVPIFDQDTLYGVLSYRDILRRYLNWSPKRDVSTKFNKMASTRSAEVDMPHLASLPVSNFTTNTDLLTIPSTMKLRDAVSIMNSKKLYSAMVMEGSRFLGALTVRNILQLLGSLKPVQNYTVKYIGVAELNLTPHQQASVERIVSTEAPKLEREIHNRFVLTVHIKEYGKGGKQQKYSVHMRVEYPGKILTCSHDDWKIETALHKTFEHAQNSLKNWFKEDKNKNKATTRKL